MTLRKLWLWVCRLAESRAAKVLALTVGSICLCQFILPLLWEIVGLVLQHPWWTASIVVCLLVIIAGVGSCCQPIEPWPNLAEFDGRTVHPCMGGMPASLYDERDCVRIDPFEGCYRYEPCLGLAYSGHNEYVNPFPKLRPRADVLDSNGVLTEKYRREGCIEVDVTQQCYRPTPCDGALA